MEKWEQQLIDNFGSAVVNKKLVLENEIQGIPRYVSEYILGAYAIDSRKHRQNGAERAKGNCG